MVLPNGVPDTAGVETTNSERDIMLTIILWLLLFIVAWPVAVLALLLYPIVWVASLPFRLVGVTVRGVFEFLEALFMLPVRLLKGPGRAVSPTQ
jgi:hypothetical protein